ncbi:MAG: IcmT/TraK family protein [Kordiimonadaceae bacterium]|nr:IcmT/TraK family protein [Kordiimonadaceae bacterium]
MDHKIDASDESWVASMYSPKLGPVDSRVLIGPVLWMCFAMTSLTILIVTGIWVATFCILALLDMTPSSALRALRNSLFGGLRPCRTFNRTRTRFLGENT